MNNGRDCPHGRQVGKCDTCDLIEAEKEIEALKVQVEQLREDSLVAFGDGFYDGYLHYAKLCGDLEFTDDVMRQSELAEADSIFGKMVGSSVRVAEIKAQAVINFADMIRGAYLAGFVPSDLNVYDVYQSARNHVKDKYKINIPAWDDQVANQLRQQAKAGE